MSGLNNIEEAVQLTDRILVPSSNPGRIRAEVAVAMPRPRGRHDPGFEQLVDAAVLLGLAHVHDTQLEITQGPRGRADPRTSRTGRTRLPSVTGTWIAIVIWASGHVTAQLRRCAAPPGLSILNDV